MGQPGLLKSLLELERHWKHTLMTKWDTLNDTRSCGNCEHMEAKQAATGAPTMTCWSPNVFSIWIIETMHWIVWLRLHWWGHCDLESPSIITHRTMLYSCNSQGGHVQMPTGQANFSSMAYSIKWIYKYSVDIVVIYGWNFIKMQLTISCQHDDHFTLAPSRLDSASVSW